MRLIDVEPLRAAVARMIGRMPKQMDGQTVARFNTLREMMRLIDKQREVRSDGSLGGDDGRDVNGGAGGGADAAA